MSLKAFDQRPIELSSHGQMDGFDGPSRDELDMQKQGKTQQFNRNFGPIQLLGLGTTMMCTWEAIFFANTTAMLNGGAPSLVFGFLFCWVGALFTAASLAELASMAPISGGQYHWVAILAPENSKKFLSWITGWLATTGWNANIAAGIYFSGTMIQGLLVQTNANYDYQRWQGTLLMYAVVCLVIFINTVAARLLPKIEGVILVIHTLGFFAILIPLVYLSPHNSASEVFTEFVDSAGWSSGGLAFFVGLISNNLPLIGYDGPCHLAEEVRNAAVTVPWCMVMTVVVNGAFGLGIAIAFAFCTVDVPDALTSPTGYDFIYVFYQATQSNAATSVMTAVLIILVTCASVGFLATTSRQTFAFARDNGLPCSRWLSRVSPTRKIPLNAVAFCTVITVLICLINVFSTAAFNAITSLTIAGLYVSYFIPVALVCYRRMRGDAIPFGPWSLGKWGVPVNVICMIYLVISTVFSFFPPAVPVTLVSMNWSCVVFGGIVIIGLAYYWGSRKWVGPIKEE